MICGNKQRRYPKFFRFFGHPGWCGALTQWHPLYLFSILFQYLCQKLKKGKGRKMLIFLSAVKLYYIFCLTSDFIFRYKYVLIKIFGNIFFRKSTFCPQPACTLKKEDYITTKAESKFIIKWTFNSNFQCTFCENFKNSRKSLASDFAQN